MTSGRRYHQTVRAEATERLRRRIVEAFLDCARDQWFDEITLDEVARRAGTTVRTVIRQFDGKDGLVAGVAQYVTPAISERRTVTPGDVDGAVERLFENYEQDGDLTIRALAQELRYPALRPGLEAGRVGHRAVAAANFGPWLDRLSDARRDAALDALVIVTDIYAWKLLRRDMGRSEAQSKPLVKALIQAVLVQLEGERTDGPRAVTLKVRSGSIFPFRGCRRMSGSRR